jgi:hypothetical protein
VQAQGKRDYTPKAYLAFVGALQGVATRLNAASSAAGGVCIPDADAAEAVGAPAGGEWSAVLVERALWAVSIVGVPADDEDEAAAGKGGAGGGASAGEEAGGKGKERQKEEKEKGGEADEPPPKAKRRRA